MKEHAHVLIFTFALVSLLAGNPLWASQNATIVGGVQDSAGNGLAGAEVHLINDLTGFSRVQVTEADGSYTFNEVPATDATEDEYYLLWVEKPGFVREQRKITSSVGESKWVQPPFRLTPLQAPAAQPAAQPVAPQPAGPPPSQPQPTAPAQPAAVKSAAAQPPKAAPATAPEGPTVRTDLISNMLGGVIDSRALRALPLADRDFLDLALLAPGTYPVEQGSVLAGASLVVNGIRADMNEFLLDGADNNDYTINQSLPFQIVEAMQEFRVQASTSPAEFGRNGGAQVNSLSRRGLNTVHGTLFEYHRNSRLSENGYFSAYSGGGFDRYNREVKLLNDLNPTLGIGSPLDVASLASLYNRKKAQVVQNQFGGNVGGALKKDKLFGFVNWESFRVSNPRPVFERVPGTTWRQQTAEPCTGLSLDPTAVALYKLYPAPNVGTTKFTNPSEPLINDPTFGCIDDDFQSAYFVGESGNKTATDNFLERLDLRKGDRASMSFKHNIQRIDQVQGGDVPKTPNYPGNGTDINGLNQNFSYNYVQQVTSRTDNELRLGWNRFRLDALALDRKIDPAGLGFQNLNFHDRGTPKLSVGELAFSLAPDAALGSDLSVPSKRANNVWSAADNVSYSRGRNNLKFGGEYRYVRLDVANEALGRGMIAFFRNSFVPLFGEPDLAAIARVNPAFGGGFDRRFLTHDYAGFLQDQWRIRPNFTFNFGVRYEVNTAPVEARDRLVNYYPSLGGLVRAGSTDILSPFVDNSYNLIVLGKATKRVPRAGFDTDTNNFAPRAGFAWDPWKNGKTVLRGGYAILYDEQPLDPSVNMLLNPPFVQQDLSLFSLFTLDQVFQIGTPAFSSPNGWFRLPNSITARDPGTRTPYVQQFNFGVQRQLGPKALFELAYVGSVGRKLPRLRDVSQCNRAIKALVSPDPAVCFDLSQPFLFTSTLNQENSAKSNFHSLLVSFESRGFRGLQVQANYQFAKSIDDASSMQPQVFLFTPSLASLLSSFFEISPEVFAGANNISPTLSLRPDLPIVTTRPRLPQDSDNLHAERARSDFALKHRFVLNFIYDVPRWDRLRALGKGWQLAGIAGLQSGQPYSVYADFFGTPYRPNQLRRPRVNNSNPGAAIDISGPGMTDPTGSLFFNGSDAGALAINFDPNTFFLLPGNLGRNTFTGPTLQNADFAVVKNTYVGAGERKFLQFRAEFFNAFNTLNFHQPYSKGGVAFNDSSSTAFFGGGAQTVLDPFFGKILQARRATEIQFALKFSF